MENIYTTLQEIYQKNEVVKGVDTSFVIEIISNYIPSLSKFFRYYEIY